MRMLTIAAHPDDETLGCGGTLARWARERHDTFILILGEGITSRCDSRDEADPRLLTELRDSSYKAAKLLGAKDIFLHDFPDNRFDTIPLLDIIKTVEKYIHKIEPDVIYTQCGGDLNVDHAITYRATLTAARPTSDSPVKAVYSYEAPSSTEWAFESFSPAFHPNVFVNITDTLDLKLQAMQCYEGEARPFPHPRSPKALESVARRWGSVIGAQAAEAFQLVRMLV